MAAHRIAHSPRRGMAGFTLAEVLAGMLFTAIVIPATVHGLLVANRAGVCACRTRTAVQLADQQLTETVLTDEWRAGETEGDFGEEYPGFRWVLTDEAWEEDAMRLVHKHRRRKTPRTERSFGAAEPVVCGLPHHLYYSRMTM